MVSTAKTQFTRINKLMDKRKAIKASRDEAWARVFANYS